MKQALHTTATVQAGRRIAFEVPDLEEGQSVEVYLLPIGPDTAVEKIGLADFLDSLPPSKRTEEEWRAFDEEFRKARDEWDR